MIACRENIKDGDESFKTMECLRGRLQAERQASRSAKKEAELMCSKLVELENLLKQELKLKKRAEKKLVLLKKKLEAMKSSSESSTNQKKSESSEKMEDNASENSSSISKSNDPSSSRSTQSYGDSKMYEKSEMAMDGGDLVDETWALVPVTWPALAAAEQPSAAEMRMRSGSGSVDEVLDVLRRAREGLKSSMERSMIRVGSACK